MAPLLVEGDEAQYSYTPSTDHERVCQLYERTLLGTVHV